eukprot:2242294-Prymnesium_polylepis.1
MERAAGPEESLPPAVTPSGGHSLRRGARAAAAHPSSDRSCGYGVNPCYPGASSTGARSALDCTHAQQKHLTPTADWQRHAVNRTDSFEVAAKSGHGRKCCGTRVLATHHGNASAINDEAKAAPGRRNNRAEDAALVQAKQRRCWHRIGCGSTKPWVPETSNALAAWDRGLWGSAMLI